MPIFSRSGLNRPPPIISNITDATPEGFPQVAWNEQTKYANSAKLVMNSTIPMSASKLARHHALSAVIPCSACSFRTISNFIWQTSFDSPIIHCFGDFVKAILSSVSEIFYFQFYIRQIHILGLDAG